MHNTYMDMYLSRKVIVGSNNKDVQKDLDKSVRLGNTYYPNKLENVTGLILQYDKEKERELLRKKKYKDKFNIITTIIIIVIKIPIITTTETMVRTMIKQKLSESS